MFIHNNDIITFYYHSNTLACDTQSGVLAINYQNQNVINYFALYSCVVLFFVDFHMLINHLLKKKGIVELHVNIQKLTIVVIYMLLLYSLTTKNSIIIMQHIC